MKRTIKLKELKKDKFFCSNLKWEDYMFAIGYEYILDAFYTQPERFALNGNLSYRKWASLKSRMTINDKIFVKTYVRLIEKVEGRNE